MIRTSSSFTLPFRYAHFSGGGGFRSTHFTAACSLAAMLSKETSTAVSSSSGFGGICTKEPLSVCRHYRLLIYGRLPLIGVAVMFPPNRMQDVIARDPFEQLTGRINNI